MIFDSVAARVFQVGFITSSSAPRTFVGLLALFLPASGSVSCKRSFDRFFFAFGLPTGVPGPAASEKLALPPQLGSQSPGG